MRRLLPALSLVLLATCRDPTQVTFEVRTDLRCDEITDTAIATGTLAEVEAKAATSTSTTCVDGRVGALVVAPADDDDAELAVRVVTATKGRHADECTKDNGYKGCIVSRRSVRYSAHKTLRVGVMMRASCIDAPCDGAGFTTCVKGTCVTGRVDAAKCEGAGCDEATLDGPAIDATCPPAPLPPGASPQGWSRIAGFAGVIAARGAASLVWSCSEAILWGGTVPAATRTAPGDGVAYSPRTNTWRPIRPAPFRPRILHVAIWTGRAMFVWGGLSFQSAANNNSDILSDGALYNPSADAWTPIPEDFLPALVAPAAVYSPVTDEVVLWGAEFVNPPRSTGAAFSLKTRTWRRIAAAPAGFAPRRAPTAVFLDGKMVVAGGEAVTTEITYFADGAAYDPAADTWSVLPSSGVKLPAGETFRARRAGKAITVVAGVAPNDGAYFDGAGWTPIPALAASTIPSPQRRGSTVFASDRQLFRWGGILSQSTPFADGAALDVATRTWSRMPPSVLSARTGAPAVWTGSYAIVAGGTSGTTSFDDAAIYIP